MQKIIIIGGGGHAKVLISILKKLSSYEITGYTDMTNCGDILGIKYLGTDEEIFENKNFEKISLAVLGIGQIKNFNFRKKIVERYLANGYNFPAIISPDAIINEDVKIGNGTVLMDWVIINSGTEVKDFSIINTGVIVEHDCTIGSYTHLAPGTVLSGTVNVGNNTLLGTGSVVINNIDITNEVIIPAGSVVRKDVEQKGIFIGKKNS